MLIRALETWKISLKVHLAHITLEPWFNCALHSLGLFSTFSDWLSFWSFIRYIIRYLISELTGILPFSGVSSIANYLHFLQFNVHPKSYLNLMPIYSWGAVTQISFGQKWTTWIFILHPIWFYQKAFCAMFLWPLALIQIERCHFLAETYKNRNRIIWTVIKHEQMCNLIGNDFWKRQNLNIPVQK